MYHCVFKDIFYLLLVMEREEEREGEKYQCVVVPHAPSYFDKVPFVYSFKKANEISFCLCSLLEGAVLCITFWFNVYSVMKLLSFLLTLWREFLYLEKIF